MSNYYIQGEAEELKGLIWEAIDDKETPIAKEVKETMNLLLDLLDELFEE